MDAAQWILIMILGGIAGSLGQSTRVIIGLKKLDAQASAAGMTREDLFKTSRIVVSLLIGFTAGALAALLAKIDPTKIQVDQLLAFAAAGYAGADFIEGFMSRIAPTGGQPVPVLAGNTPPVQPQNPADDGYVG